MKQYSVKQVANMAGISIRTLHYYDRLGLLKPAVRTEAHYRRYGQPELLRLQQILFYRELDFSLDEIRTILQQPAFDLATALRNHKQALIVRRDRLTTLLTTIDKTIDQLNGTKTMMTDDELYAGFGQQQGLAYRQEATQQYGEAVVAASEQHLRQGGKAYFEQLKAEQQAITATLATITHLDPASAVVQEQIARHYANILAFWGGAVQDTRSAYKGLAQLYADDPRYTSQNGQANPAYAAFLRAAMLYFAA